MFLGISYYDFISYTIMKYWYSLYDNMIMTRLDYTLLIAGVGETGAPRGKPTKTAVEVTSLLG